MLALDLPRPAWVLGKLSGFLLLATLFALPFGALTLLFAPWQNSLQWTCSLVWELWIIAGFALLVALSFNQILSALAAVLAFYLLTRSIAALQLMAQGPLAALDNSQLLLRQVLDALAWVLPNLDRFTRADWLLYGNINWLQLVPLLAQSLVYLLLLAAAATFDLYRKQI